MKISRPVLNQNKRSHMQVVLLILKWEEKFKYKKSKENTAGRGLWGLKTARICFYFCLFIIRSVVVILVLLGFWGVFFGGGGVFYSLSVDIWQKRWLYHLRYIFLKNNSNCFKNINRKSKWKTQLYFCPCRKLKRK